jgi:hypothetical protein
LISNRDAFCQCRRVRPLPQGIAESNNKEAEMKAMKDSELALVGGAYNTGYPDQHPGPIEPPFVWPWPLPTGTPPISQPIVIPFGP